MTRARKPREAVTGAVYPEFVLTDEQWDETAKLSSIPRSAVKARLELQTVVGMHRRHTQLRMLSDGARDELAAIGHDVRKLEARFKRLAELLPTGWSAPDFPIEIAVYGATCSKPGAKTGEDYILVAYLIGLAARFGGKEIRRSKKRNDTSMEYVKYVCAIADPSIGRGTIENAMKYYSRRRGQTLDEAAAEGLLAFERKAERKAKKASAARGRIARETQDN